MKIYIVLYFLLHISMITIFAQNPKINYSTSQFENNLLINKPSQTLPVELIYFYAISQSNGIFLKWGTATEVNNFGFEIERAYNLPTGWETIDFVLGGGTSNVPIDYEYLDSLANMTGMIYYRLKQIDIIGGFEYSDTVFVSFINSVELMNNVIPQISNLSQNYPNPFNSTTNFQINVAKMSEITMELFDSNGQKIKTLFRGELYPGTYSYQLNMNDFSSGTYLIKFLFNDYSLIKKVLLLK